MRCTSLSPTLLAGLALLGAQFGAPLGARAQGPASAATPSACVAATGPDTAPPPVGRVSRPAAPGGVVRDSAERTALRLFAAVEAQEVRFERQPTICVRLHGDVRLDSVRVVGRRNLASPVVRGTTYRDVYVAVEILGHLNAECISARITGAPSSASAASACASLGVRDSTAGRRTGAPPP